MAFIKQKLEQKSKLVSLVVILVWLVIWLALVSPTSGPPILLLLPFVLIFILLYRFTGWLILGFGSKSGIGYRRKAVVWLVSSLLEVLLVMSSLAQLGIGDIVTVTAIAIIGLFYILKLAPNKSN